MKGDDCIFSGSNLEEAYLIFLMEADLVHSQEIVVSH
jgi:hypothetical protein